MLRQRKHANCSSFITGFESGKFSKLFALFKGPEEDNSIPLQTGEFFSSHFAYFESLLQKFRWKVGLQNFVCVSETVRP